MLFRSTTGTLELVDDVVGCCKFWPSLEESDVDEGLAARAVSRVEKGASFHLVGLQSPSSLPSALASWHAGV